VTGLPPQDSRHAMKFFSEGGDVFVSYGNTLSSPVGTRGSFSRG